MSSFDREYYILKREDDRVPTRPQAFHETAERDFRNSPCAAGSPPLAFFNGSRRKNRQRGISILPEPPRTMFDGASLLARNDVRDGLFARGITGLHTHPAWYVHDDKSLHNDYCYISFGTKFDCWDRQLSDHDDEDDGSGLDPLVYTFSLDTQLMARTPLNERLLFVMGGCFSPPLVCHESLLPLFLGSSNSGVRATVLPDA